MYRKNFKRVLDIIISFFGLVLLFPILVIATTLLAITNQGKPFFFRHVRGKTKNYSTLLSLRR